jgi:hypothetical protein
LAEKKIDLFKNTDLHLKSNSNQKTKIEDEKLQVSKNNIEISIIKAADIGKKEYLKN